MAKVKGEVVRKGQIGQHVPPKHAPKKPVAKTRGKTTHHPSPDKTRKKPPQSKQGTKRADKTGAAAYGRPDQFPGFALAHPPTFRFSVQKSNGDVLQLSHVTNASWDDVNAILTGSIQFTEPVFDRFDPYTLVDQGDRISCEVDTHAGRGFTEAWLMRTKTPQLGVNDNTRSFELANDLSLALGSEGNFLYKPDHSHKGGWYGHDIILDVCERFQIPVGRIYQSDWRIPKLWLRRGGPLTVIRNVLLKELRHTRRRMVTRFIGGRLYIVPLQRSPHLRALGPTLMDAAFKSELRPEFATAVLMRGLQEFTYADQNKQHNKMHHLRVSQTSVNQFGYVQKILWSPDARNDSELAAEGDAYLAEVAKPHKTLSLTTPGIIGLHRGDAIQLGLGDDALRRQVVWVDEVNHTLTPQQYLSTITVIFDDPFVPHSELRRIFKLKATREEAIGNRATKDPTGWYLTKNQKGDGNYAASRQAAVFDSANAGAANDPADAASSDFNAGGG
jgi:hypothetical protein